MKGKCHLCRSTYAKAGMRRHLESCREKRGVSEHAGRGRGKTKLLHLVVEGRYLPEYWMHLEVDARATFGDLDDFLRKTWLECCGHLSAFTIEGGRYVSEPEELGFGGPEEKGMDVEMGAVLTKGMKFLHEYDFGTTTELVLRMASEREGEAGRLPVRLLARSEPPAIPCSLCGKEARWVCSRCMHTGEAWLCDECAGLHGCGEDALLPVVNSPRVGMCGYIG